VDKLQFGRRALLATAISLAACGGALAQPAAGYADLLLVNGKVVTVDKSERIASAVAVRGDKIAAVGDAASLAAMRGPQTRVVDLQGRTLLPGFIDSHSHIGGMARVEALYTNIQVPPLKDANAIVEVLKAKAATLPKGTWIVGQGTYNQVMPSREQLDKALPDHPVELQWSVHDHLINHRAAMEMGLTKDYPDPTGTGRFERTANGEVAIIRDAPAPWPKRKELTEAEAKEGVRKILDDFYLKKGVTTVYDHADGQTVKAYQELKAEGRLPTRIRISYMVRGGDSLDAILRTGMKTGLGDDWLKMGSIKFVADGVWGTTAYVYKPFWNGSGTTWIPNNHGGTSYTQETLNKAVLAAHSAGWQVQIHANGDRAQDMVLTAFEEAQKAVPRPDARHRIEHFGHFLTQDPQRTEERMQRMIRGKIIPSPQMAFLWRLTDVNVKEPDVKFFPMRTLIDRGMHPAGGVDTVGTQNFATPPIFSISRGVRRDTKFGAVVQPEEAITPMEGIKMFTIWAAEAGFLEDSRGSIETGKLADMVVLDQDPLTASKDQLPNVKVAMTILGGKVAYEAP
jgi:predicted amidohydrolase YtcJ